jgi:hypothetical protein
MVANYNCKHNLMTQRRQQARKLELIGIQDFSGQQLIADIHNADSHI